MGEGKERGGWGRWHRFIEVPEWVLHSLRTAGMDGFERHKSPTWSARAPFYPLRLDLPLPPSLPCGDVMGGQKRLRLRGESERDGDGRVAMKAGRWSRCMDGILT